MITNILPVGANIIKWFLMEEIVATLKFQNAMKNNKGSGHTADAVES